ncbi:DUF58 domain-containing protein [Hoyosella altamirensis]|uniref:Uncharacterized protein (DUF58 family) n=1 Tax=Hoyosella altamirensis TaxID=616997 RepID=A0A839RIY8_9ACTN|nr:DUF58 domain-containing protein [Hoyosella altamirensis]MBB3036635.1 uncharacterized protein (DUF58 family) [Hoyosella altamirensis]
MVLTGRAGFLAAVGALVVGVFMPSAAGVVLVTGLVVLLVGADVVFAGSVRDLRMERGGDAAVRLGETATVRLTVTNRGSRRIRGVLRDAWPPSAGAVPDRFDANLAPGGRSTFTVAVTPTRRGDRAAVKVTVRAIGPLGCAGRQGHHRVPWTVRALPPFRSRKHLPSRLARLRELDGRQAVLVRGEGTEFDSLREYVIGDDVRSIDWRATARASDVMVRTWRPERDRRIIIVLDTGRTSAGRVGDAPRLDAAMDAALLLAALASRAGDRVDFAAYDRRLRASVTGVSGAGLLAAMVNAMAPLTAELVETDAAGLVSEVLRRARQRALVVVVSPMEPASVEAGFLPALRSLTARHRVIFASVADPSVQVMSRARGSSDDVYTAAAAERTIADRRRVAGLLTKLGVTVIDEPPEDLPPALADTYIALKAAGKL